MPALVFEPLQHPGLILNDQELAAVRGKVDSTDWARQAYDQLVAEADGWLSDPVAIPDRKGQWMHYYACADDGTSLKTVSDTEHRCPACGKVYTGEPYDSVVIRNRHMSIMDSAVTLGLAYHLSRKAEYLAAAKKIVLGYADRYLSYPYADKDGRREARSGGRVFCTTLNESNWLIQAAWAYDLVAGDLSEMERRHVCQDMLYPAGNDVIRNNRLRIHNIQCWMNSAMGCAALCCGEGDLAHHAIRSEFGLENQLAKGILDDGSWWECSWGYHFYTLSALWPLTEAVRHIGHDVYDDRYKSLFDAPLNFAFPGLYLPPLNDSGRGSSILSRAKPYEIAYARWQDPRHGGVLAQMDRTDRLSLCFGVPQLTTAPPEMSASINFPAAGVAILRDGADDPTVVTLDYGPHGGGHGHPDKLGIVLYAAGREMAPDPGSIQYAAPLHQEWFKTTISHNTISVDMQPQEPCTGELHLYDVRAGVQTASAAADDAYPGVRFRRSVALVPGGIVLDVCEIDSNQDHVYDWVHHNRGELSCSLDLAKMASPVGEQNGYQHIASPRRGSTQEDWSAVWLDNDAGVALRMVGAPGTVIIAGEGPANPPPLMYPMVIARRKGRQALFCSAFAVFRGAPPVVEFSVAVEADAVHLSVQVGGASHDVALPRIEQEG